MPARLQERSHANECQLWPHPAPSAGAREPGGGPARWLRRGPPGLSWFRCGQSRWAWGRGEARAGDGSSMPGVTEPGRAGSLPAPRPRKPDRLTFNRPSLRSQPGRLSSGLLTRGRVPAPQESSHGGVEMSVLAFLPRPPLPVPWVTHPCYTRAHTHLCPRPPDRPEQPARRAARQARGRPPRPSVLVCGWHSRLDGRGSRGKSEPSAPRDKIPVTSSSQLPGAAEGAGPPRILASAGWTVTTAAEAFALGPLWSTETQFVSTKSTWYHNKSTGGE